MVAVAGHDDSDDDSDGDDEKEDARTDEGVALARLFDVALALAMEGRLLFQMAERQLGLGSAGKAGQGRGEGLTRGADACCVEGVGEREGLLEGADRRQFVAVENCCLHVKGGDWEDGAIASEGNGADWGEEELEL